MKQTIWIGVASALVTGIAIGVQATLSNRGGQAIGALRTTLISNLGSGIFAVLVAAILMALRLILWKDVPRPITIMLLLSGALGVFIVMGAAYSLRFTGVTAGIATIILGQLLISIIVDSIGWGGLERIPLTPQRILGLLVMGLAVFLLLPRR
jgi:transporter family-2 protein